MSCLLFFNNSDMIVFKPCNKKNILKHNRWIKHFNCPAQLHVEKRLLFTHKKEVFVCFSTEKQASNIYKPIRAFIV